MKNLLFLLLLIILINQRCMANWRQEMYASPNVKLAVNLHQGYYLGFFLDVGLQKNWGDQEFKTGLSPGVSWHKAEFSRKMRSYREVSVEALMTYSDFTFRLGRGKLLYLQQNKNRCYVKDWKMSIEYQVLKDVLPLSVGYGTFLVRRNHYGYYAENLDLIFTRVSGDLKSTKVMK